MAQFAPPSLAQFRRRNQVSRNSLNAKMGGITCLEVRPFESSPGKQAEPQTKLISQEYYQIVWIRKGAARLNVDIDTHEIGDNHVFLLSPGQRYLVHPHEYVEGYCINFSQELLFTSGREAFDLFHSLEHPNRTVLRVVCLDSYLQVEVQFIVLGMIKELTNSFKSKSEALQGLLRMLMILLSRKIERPASMQISGCDAVLLRKFMLLVNSDYCEKKLVSEYASCLFVTPSHLNDVIKKNTGFTASYHIQQRIILEAKRLAIDSQVRMKEIALTLGYEDFAHFSKFFKANSGTNFTDFRRRLHADLDE
ncbi:helix-turn-helix domain-containing protein [Nostocales cyanobacterium LEGE 12452]|nr:helix-turn-helix domain-containing protein [Nostocales cyanobacterium LEGE 12452]